MSIVFVSFSRTAIMLISWIARSDSHHRPRVLLTKIIKRKELNKQKLIVRYFRLSIVVTHAFFLYLFWLCFPTQITTWRYTDRTQYIHFYGKNVFTSLVWSTILITTSSRLLLHSDVTRRVSGNTIWALYDITSNIALNLISYRIIIGRL